MNGNVCVHDLFLWMYVDGVKKSYYFVQVDSEVCDIAEFVYYFYMFLSRIFGISYYNIMSSVNRNI